MGRKSRFTSEQIAYAQKQVEAGVPITEVCRKLGVGQQTFYRWRSKCGEMARSELRRLNELEQENAKLKSIVADLVLDKVILLDALRKRH